MEELIILESLKRVIEIVLKEDMQQAKRTTSVKCYFVVL